MLHWIKAHDCVWQYDQDVSRDVNEDKQVSEKTDKWVKSIMRKKNVRMDPCNMVKGEKHIWLGMGY